MSGKTTTKKTATKSSKKTAVSEVTPDKDNSVEILNGNDGRYEIKIPYCAERPSEKSNPWRAKVWDLANALSQWRKANDANGLKFGFVVGGLVDYIYTKHPNASLRSIPDYVAQISGGMDKPSHSFLFNCHAAWDDHEEIKKLKWFEDFKTLRWSVVFAIARAKWLSKEERGSLYKDAIKDVKQGKRNLCDLTADRIRVERARVNKAKEERSVENASAVNNWTDRPKAIDRWANSLPEYEREVIPKVGQPTKTSNGDMCKGNLLQFSADTADYADCGLLRIGDSKLRISMEIDVPELVKSMNRNLLISDKEVETFITRLSDEKSRLDVRKEKKADKKNAAKKKATATVVKTAMASQAKQGKSKSKKSGEMEWTDLESVPVS